MERQFTLEKSCGQTERREYIASLIGFASAQPIDNFPQCVEMMGAIKTLKTMWLKESASYILEIYKERRHGLMPTSASGKKGKALKERTQKGHWARINKILGQTGRGQSCSGEYDSWCVYILWMAY
ncbi:hypothetical protein J6590_057924 [Homalodisca vitripennis]|nr:hypothetical protein J6590_057924 [Homalodisca vitripennis]